MLYDKPRNNSREGAEAAAKIYLTVHGFSEVRVGRLVPETDDVKERWAVEIPTKISPNKRVCDFADEVGPGYKFIQVLKLIKR